MAITQVIIRVELREEPTGEVYGKLHHLMTKRWGWKTSIQSSHGLHTELPHAMYSGGTQLPLGQLGEVLAEQISGEVWGQGVTVLVIAWSGWALRTS